MDKKYSYLPPVTEALALSGEGVICVSLPQAFEEEALFGD